MSVVALQLYCIVLQHSKCFMLLNSVNCTKYSLVKVRQWPLEGNILVYAFKWYYCNSNSVLVFWIIQPKFSILYNTLLLDYIILYLVCSKPSYFSLRDLYSYDFSVFLLTRMTKTNSLLFTAFDLKLPSSLKPLDVGFLSITAVHCGLQSFLYTAMFFPWYSNPALNREDIDHVV